VSKEIEGTEFIKQGAGIYLLGQRWNFACRLPGNRCNYNGKVLHCTSTQTEAATGLLTLRQAFKNNLVSSRQFCSSQGSHYAAEILKHLAYSPVLAPWDCTAFLTSRNTSMEESSQVLRRPH
jgi:hypothetical protein